MKPTNMLVIEAVKDQLEDLNNQASQLSESDEAAWEQLDEKLDELVRFMLTHYVD